MVLRCSIVAVATAASGLALTVSSIYGLSLLCSDLVYVILFPQLVLVVYLPRRCNKYGCLSSFTAGLVLRVLGSIIHFLASASVRQELDGCRLVLEQAASHCWACRR